MRSGTAGQIGLVPGGRIFAAHVLQRDQRRGAEDHRHVRRGRRARQHDVAAIGAQRRRAHRRNAERRGVALAEQRRGLVAAGDVVEHARHEAVFVESFSVVANRGVGLGAARDIAVEEFRNPAPRRRFEIVEREIAFAARAEPRSAARVTVVGGAVTVADLSSTSGVPFLVVGAWSGRAPAFKKIMRK